MDDVTSLLRLTSEGHNKDLEDELFNRVYRELRQIAGAIFHASPLQDPILQPTILVNEAYLRLLGPNAGSISWNSRVHFSNVAARCMRRILLDSARARYTEKRGGRLLQRIDLDESILVQQEEPERIIAIDQAIESLQEQDPRCAEVVHLRFFLGFTVEETADLLNISPKTVKRDWEFARVWLESQLQS